MKKCVLICLSNLFLGSAIAQPDTTQHINRTTLNSVTQQKKPYVIMISVDGFRWDYADKHGATYLQQFGREGVHATSMLPSFPSLTFPNHYSIATGLYPSHHGIVQNNFYDRNSRLRYSYKSVTAGEGRWYGGTPLWVLAERQKMLAASFYWVGSEANIGGTYPSYFYKYNEAIGINERIKTVVNWLKLPAERRPHLITLYFPEVDHAGHHHSPDGIETRDSVRLIDSAIYALTKAVKTTGLDVNFIIVSDHGMTNVDAVNVLQTPAIALDTAQFYRADEGVLMHLYAKKPEYITDVYRQIKAAAKNYDVYLKDSIPQQLHYSGKDDRYNRIGDIVLIPQWPKTFNTSGKKINPGAHGYDANKVKDMQAIFYAWGPAFKKNLTIPAFQNVDVYPMVAKLLGLTITGKVDGTKKLAEKILVKK